MCSRLVARRAIGHDGWPPHFRSVRNAGPLEGSGKGHLEQRLQYPEGSQALFWLFLGYVPFFYLQGSFRYEALGRIRFEMIVGSVLVVASVLSVSTPRVGTRKEEKSGVVGWIIATFMVGEL